MKIFLFGKRKSHFSNGERVTKCLTEVHIRDVQLETLTKCAGTLTSSNILESSCFILLRTSSKIQLFMKGRITEFGNFQNIRLDFLYKNYFGVCYFFILQLAILFQFLKISVKVLNISYEEHRNIMHRAFVGSEYPLLQVGSALVCFCCDIIFVFFETMEKLFR